MNTLIALVSKTETCSTLGRTRGNVKANLTQIVVAVRMRTRLHA